MKAVHIELNFEAMDSGVGNFPMNGREAMGCQRAGDGQQGWWMTSQQ